MEQLTESSQRLQDFIQTEGVKSFDISLENQKVSVVTTLSQDEVFEIIKKSGKKTEIIN